MKFTLNSLDVVHSFWIPRFMFQRDVIPDHTNSSRYHRDQPARSSATAYQLCSVCGGLMLLGLGLS